MHKVTEKVKKFPVLIKKKKKLAAAKLLSIRFSTFAHTPERVSLHERIPKSRLINLIFDTLKEPIN